MVAASRKHGPFDERWPSARKSCSDAVPTVPPLQAEQAADALDWETFSNRHFSGRRRHDMEALTAYAASKQGHEWRTTPARLSVVPTEHGSAAVEPEPEEAGARRLLARIAVERM